MKTELTQIIDAEEELRAILGRPREGGASANKVTNVIDEIIGGFIAKSPFVLVASSDATGNVDISPKGDPPGFVRVLDECTLAIPDRLGNQRGDTFSNVIQNPKVGLLFLIPGHRETLRVSGTARIVQDSWLLESMAVQGNAPKLALAVMVEEAFLHCPKCMIRSHLWENEQWPDMEGIPSLAQSFLVHARTGRSLEEHQAIIANDAKERLY
jgi:PPOX class probable FMN-dependent enzyme